MTIDQTARQSLKDYRLIWNPVYPNSNCFWLGAHEEIKTPVYYTPQGYAPDVGMNQRIEVYVNCALAEKQEKDYSVDELTMRLGIKNTFELKKKFYDINKIMEFNYVVFTSRSATKWICFDDSNLYVIGFKDESIDIREKVPMKIMSEIEAAKIAKPFIDGKIKYSPKNY